jgi:hypothetical protein
MNYLREPASSGPSKSVGHFHFILSLLLSFYLPSCSPITSSFAPVLYNILHLFPALWDGWEYGEHSEGLGGWGSASIVLTFEVVRTHLLSIYLIPNFQFKGIFQMIHISAGHRRPFSSSFVHIFYY